MCGPTDIAVPKVGGGLEKSITTTTKNNNSEGKFRPVDVVLEPPSLMSRYACASLMLAIFAVWGKISFLDENKAPGIGSDIHSWKTPLALTVSYLVALPLLRSFSKNVLSQVVDVKLLLKETMIVYNGGQVLLNAWMVYRFVDSLINKGHPFIGDLYTNTSGTTFAVWIHYMDKYLEFFDTFFMVLRGRMDQVSFLHVYHHISIAWAWWFAILCYPGGDAYFGALLNSWIHVMMYSYYTLSLLKFNCPWKKYLTQAQLLQFTSVVIYTIFSAGIQIRGGVAEPKHYACFAVQAFEMISMLVLFMHFYSKAYKKRKAEKRNSVGSEDTVPEQASIHSDGSDSDVATTKKQQ
ncbi:GNS1/SUR4 family protein [Nitzschia inconspicua]|uniref:Elongation of fatty acids protein n=1 Tax=Nitzschia inconspicua TaxID=303405 RepID=A0A9K3KJ44_9STRA|nr:GNS1/SUR4 family protein [Nitzschia inconspicua]